MTGQGLSLGPGGSQEWPWPSEGMAPGTALLVYGTVKSSHEAAGPPTISTLFGSSGFSFKARLS